MIRQLIIQIVPSKVFSIIRVDDPTITNAMIIFRNVYNFQTQLRRDELEFFTFIQVLIREFDRDDWVYVFEKNEKNQITNFFFTRNTCQEILKSNFEILVINCIYKINRFKMPLLVINDQTTLHIFFYVVFCFHVHINSKI